MGGRSFEGVTVAARIDADAEGRRNFLYAANLARMLLLLLLLPLPLLLSLCCP